VLGVVGLMSAPSASLIGLELRSDLNGQRVPIQEFSGQLGSWWREKRVSEEDWREWARSVNVSWTASDQRGTDQ
jgi:hypothetical protein